MAITTYAELQTAVKNWIHRADLDTYIVDFITIAEKRIFREVRTREMEASFSDTTSSNAVALPTSYIELKYAYVDKDSDQHLKRTDASFLYEKYPTSSATSSRPYFIAREGSNFIFGPPAQDGLTIKGYYYKDVGPVSSSAHTVFTTYPDLYLFASLAEAEPFLKNDKRIAVWEAKYQNLKQMINGLHDREDLSGSDLQMRPG